MTGLNPFETLKTISFKVTFTKIDRLSLFLLVQHDLLRHRIVLLNFVFLFLKIGFIRIYFKFVIIEVVVIY